MAQNTSVAKYSASKLTPLYAPPANFILPVKLAASTTFAQGTVLAEVSTTLGTYQPYSAAVLTAPATAPTVSASGADGTIAAGIYGIAYAYYNANGETTLSPWAPVVVAATNHIAVTTVTVPAGATGTRWYIHGAGFTSVRLSQTTDGTQANVLTLPVMTGAVPVSVSTAYTGTNGAWLPAGFLAMAAVTDSGGVITSFGDFNLTVFTADLMLPIAGLVLRTQDLTGFDANALAVLQGRLVEGTVTAGSVAF